MNTWTGKRAVLRQYGFGFLVLFSGRSDRELKSAAAKGRTADEWGSADGRVAVAAAIKEGFARYVLIFLDQEEGGRLLPEQAAYVFAWIDAVRAAGARPGVYCSGIEVGEGSNTTSTADDIAARETARVRAGGSADKRKKPHRLALWIADDQCPPAPGCELKAPSLHALLRPSIAGFTAVWQYAQSPWRPQFSSNCTAKPAADGNCYAPDFPSGARMFVDLDTSDSPNPSEPPE